MEGTIIVKIRGDYYEREFRKVSQIKQEGD